jgi:hypothetical protein
MLHRQPQQLGLAAAHLQHIFELAGDGFATARALKWR